MLIARIYEVLPLLCPVCGGQMRLIAFITHSADIRQILDHIGVESEPPHITLARGPLLWEQCDAQMGEGVEVEADWDMAAQPAPVRVNPASSSIVIDYRPTDTVFHFRLQDDPSVNTWLRLEGEDALLAEIDETVTAGSRYLGRHSRLAEATVSTAEQIDSSVRNASHGYLDLKVLLPLGVAVATSLHKARGRGTPMWLTVSTFAFNAFLALHRQRTDMPVVQIVSAPKSRV